ncbi:MAG: hypothetical protein RJB26_324 [Pseudomonadota bacterium]
MTPDAWYNLGLEQRRRGQPQAALESYARALAAGISEPEEVHLNRGVIFADDLRDPEAARAELDQALALNPRYQPALLNLGNLHEDLGEREAATAVYSRLLELAPGHPEALARRAGLLRVQGPDDAAARTAVEELRAALQRPLAVEPRAGLGFALGRLLDALQNYDGAFAAYTAAHEGVRASLPPGTVLYDRVRQERLVDALIATFTASRVASWRAALGGNKANGAAGASGAGASAAPVVFVLGMFRSGSTLVEQVLAAHPAVASGGEAPALPRLVAQYLGAGSVPFPQSLNSVGPAHLLALARDYLAAMAPLRGTRELVTDKRPDNFLLLGLILTLFPAAKVVHTTRHPLDNCLSVHFQHLDAAVGYAANLEDTAHYYGQYRRLMQHWESLFPGHIHTVDYDVLVREPLSVVQQLLAYCGLPWNEGCLAFHTASVPVRTASVWQVREPLYLRASGRWQHYAKHLESLRAALARWL